MNGFRVLLLAEQEVAKILVLYFAEVRERDGKLVYGIGEPEESGHGIGVEVLRSFGEEDVELEALKVEDVTHDLSVRSRGGRRDEIDERLMVDVDVEGDTILEVGGEVHDKIMQCHGFDLCYAE